MFNAKIDLTQHIYAAIVAAYTPPHAVFYSKRKKINDEQEKGQWQEISRKKPTTIAKQYRQKKRTKFNKNVGHRDDYNVNESEKKKRENECERVYRESCCEECTHFITLSNPFRQQKCASHYVHKRMRHRHQKVYDILTGIHLFRIEYWRQTLNKH